MIKLSLIVFLSLFLFACEKSQVENLPQGEHTTKDVVNTSSEASSKLDEKAEEKKEALPKSAFMLAEWTDLIPEDDLNALLNPPNYLDEIIDGSAEDQLGSPMNNDAQNSEDERYQKALTSARVIDVVNNAAIKLPAYIVPLEFDDDQKVTQFFLVPYFGACLHLPPPPPNQTIFVNYPQGLKLESLYDAYWISGILKISTVESDIATAAYTIDMQYYELYTDENY